MDCAWVSSRSRSMSQNCASYSVRHSRNRKLAAHWIPHEISEMQQWHRCAVAQALLDPYEREGDDFLGRIVAMDETWAHLYKPNLKCQSNEWKHPSSPHPEKVCPTSCPVKVMSIVAYDIDGIILHQAVSLRRTVNTAYYCIFLQHHLCPALRRKRWHLVVQNPIILNDNSRSHTAAAVMDHLCHWQWEILEHPLYSPDMSPCNYNLFAKVKNWDLYKFLLKFIFYTMNKLYLYFLIFIVRLLYKIFVH